MIRVNLSEPVRPVERRQAFSLHHGQHISLVGSLLLLVTALLIGWRYWALMQVAADLDRTVAAARQEEAQLSSILQQVQSFELRRQQLQQRVALIDELRKGQAAPVHIIDQVSRALPDGMWLTRLQQAGYDVTIEGECQSLTALSDFVGNLAASHYFTRPVEILTSQVVAARENLPEVIRFAVKGTFQMAGIDPAPPAKPGPAGGKRG